MKNELKRIYDKAIDEKGAIHYKATEERAIMWNTLEIFDKRFKKCKRLEDVIGLCERIIKEHK